ncbi:MAG: tetratricopeptide (TPR) repeat protein [Planctomycetota bacterium]|jgi:tetratricopeptide (TPR) repeat protein
MKSFFTCLLLSLILCSSTAWAQGPSIEVTVNEESGEVLLSIRAKHASIHQLLPAIASQLSDATNRPVAVVGLDKLAREAHATAFLIERPWKDALRWIAGSAGLAVVASSSRIQIQEEVADFAKPKELLLRSLLAHRQVLASYPQSPRVPSLLLKAGTIAAQLGPAFYTSAQNSFDTIIEDHSNTGELWEALFRLGGVYYAMGEWDKAALQFHEVADSSISHGYHVRTRKELARALCQAGKETPNPVVREDYGTTAVLTIEALDRFYPASDIPEQRERAVLLGTALSLTSDPVRALRALDLAVEKSPSGVNDPEILAVRAVALSRAGHHGTSSIAWLAVGNQATGTEREEALLRAAKEALKGDHSLAVMSICAIATKEGFGDRLATYNLEAKMRLGIADETEGYTLTQRLSRAVELHNRREHNLAVEAMRPLFIRRSEFDSAESLKLALSFAKSLHAESLSQDAIETLRLQASETTSALNKREIYKLAAQIYESRENFPAAIEALKGNL